MGDFATALAKRSFEGRKKLDDEYRKQFAKVWEAEKVSMFSQADKGQRNIQGGFTFVLPKEEAYNTAAFVADLSPPFVQELIRTKCIDLKYTLTDGADGLATDKGFTKRRAYWEMSYEWKQLVGRVAQNAADADPPPPAKKVKAEVKAEPASA